MLVDSVGRGECGSASGAGTTRCSGRGDDNFSDGTDDDADTIMGVNMVPAGGDALEDDGS